MSLFRWFVALTVASSVAAESDWPQWLGPNRDGSTTLKVVPWKGSLKIVWKQPIGEGHSSPVVEAGRVYLHSRPKGKDAEAVDCFEADSGKPLWHKEYARPAFTGLFGSGPRATPTVAGGKVYAYGATGILTCFDAASGETAWQLNTKAEFKPPQLKFGVSSSPLVVGNKVLIDVGAKGASIVAVDKDNGKVLWKSLDDGASYASPIMIGSKEDPTGVFLTQSGLVGVRVQDGSKQWSFPFKDALLESSTTPVKVGDKVLVSSITLGSALVSFDTKDGKTTANKIWLKSDLPCYFSTPVALGTDYLYLVTGSIKGGSSSLHCVEAKSGKELWKKDGVGKFHASLVRTGDNKLLMVEVAGNLVLIEPDPAKYHELARTKICGNTWAHPAVANGRLYIRDDKDLVCVDLSGAGK